MTDDNFMFGHDPLEDMPEEYAEPRKDLFNVEDIDINPLCQAFMQEVAKKVGIQHLSHVDQLAAAFISRYHVDPADAEVQTEMKHGPNGPVWVTTIQRRVPDGREA
jgi:hypothetical protein